MSNLVRKDSSAEDVSFQHASSSFAVSPPEEISEENLNRPANSGVTCLPFDTHWPGCRRAGQIVAPFSLEGLRYGGLGGATGMADEKIGEVLRDVKGVD